MQFLTRRPEHPASLGILPGTFNPPTSAHLALAEAALSEVDEVVLVLPRTFPHKDFSGATFDQRAHMLCALLAGRARLSAASAAGGLFIDIAHECRAVFGPDVPLTFVCGRDAAERIVNWDYGNKHIINEILDSFSLLVACREGAFEPPPHLCHAIRPLALPSVLNAVSASEVRRRIQIGFDWENLVPAPIVPLVREIYRPSA